MNIIGEVLFSANFMGTVLLSGIVSMAEIGRASNDGLDAIIGNDWRGCADISVNNCVDEGGWRS